ncbi:MAG TPA: shikimate dehydrogenase [Bacillales bacterium]|nr:shikimate dehydrogenase [Bacillales bacterium]
MEKTFALIGHPVAHSLSPIMHNAAFKSLELPHIYVKFDVQPQRLKDAVIGMKALGIGGFNVTVPHKVAILPYLDEVDEQASVIGAVNTVVNENGRWIGTNTDGRGFLLSLQDVAGDRLPDCRVLMIGAGGAARAAAAALDEEGVKRLDVANRTLEKAHGIKTGPAHRTDGTVVSLAEAEECVGEYDIIINTTSVGLHPNAEAMPISLSRLRERTIVADLIYNPLKTKWLRVAEEKGAVVMNGVGMFVAQGALAFERWTGYAPDRRLMRRIVLDELGGERS